MSDNPQDLQTPGPNEPKEPGEIGWPADADAPGDPSLPQPGSGGATATVPGPTPANDGEPVETVEEWTPAPVEEPAAETIEESGEQPAE